MRLLFVLALVLAAVGCTTEVGRGDIAPLELDLPIDAAAQPPPLAGSVELELLSSDDAASLGQQYGSKLGAVDTIDLEVDQLGLLDDAAQPVGDASLSMTVETLTIDHVGQRVRLPDALEKRVIAAIRQGQPLDVTVAFQADWPAAASPVTAHALVQWILVVDTLRAL